MTLISGTGISRPLQSESAPPNHLKETSERLKNSTSLLLLPQPALLSVILLCTVIGLLGCLMQMIFSLLIQTQYDVLQELSDAAAETETSLLLSGLVINCHVCLFVMTPRRNLSALSHASLS